MKKYYAITTKYADSPAFGVGETEKSAWEEAATCEIDLTDLVCYEITRDSYFAVLNGNVDDYEPVDDLYVKFNNVRAVDHNLPRVRVGGEGRK